MTNNADTPVAVRELEQTNRELAALLRTRPAELAMGADVALHDELVICGILGGKDVGKSTLINALAQTEVSVDLTEVGRGTERPMAYVHETMRDALAHRLQATDRRVPVDVTTHEAEPIRNVVLVDLPDFDSEFLNHLQVVRAVAPLLDRILWVLTPRKIGDRAWVDIFHDIIKDPTNVHCVLNKVDELLADSEPFGAAADARAADNGRAERFWRQQHEWVARSIESVGCPQSDEHRYLVAAAFPDSDRFISRIAQLWNDLDWDAYAADHSAVTKVAHLASGELDRLRSCVLGPVTADQGCAIKAANRDRELRVNIARIKHHYNLDRTTERLAQACDPQYLQQVLNEATGPEYCAAVGAAIQTQLRPDTELADELLERRVEHWPLLRLVHWPFGWLSRTVGRRVTTRTAPNSEFRIANSETGIRQASGVRDFSNVGGILAERIDLVRSRILADHAVIAQCLGLDSQLPEAASLAERLAAALRRLPAQLETRLLDDIRGRDRRPSIFGKAALWFIFLWFPFVQPILAGLLEIFAETGSFRIAHGLYRIVSALSATHLLAGFTVVTGIFVALLAAMYARSLRAVRKIRDEHSASSPIAEAVDEILVSEVVLPLATPFHDGLERLTALHARLEEQEGAERRKSR